MTASIVFWIENAALKAGRKTCVFYEIDLDYCQEVFGVGACTAGQVAGDTAQAGAATTITLAAADSEADDYYNNMVIKITGGTGSGQEKTITDYVNATKVATVDSTWTTNPDATSTYTIHEVNSATACFNTRQTCQDTTNYNKGTKTYRFAEPVQGLPKTIEYYPCMEDPPSFTSTKLEPGKSVAQRGSVVARFADFKHHDRGIDPYVANRTYDANEQGTFFPKWISRNKHYVGRVVRVKTGYLRDAFSWDYFDTRYYVLDKIDGPDANGVVTIHAKDQLRLADNDWSKTPETSQGKLSADILAGASSLVLTPSGIGSGYGSSGTIRIGSNILTFTGRTSDTLTGLSGGQWGTTDTGHSADDLVQLCTVYEGTNVVDIIYDLVVNVAGIDASLVPYNNDASDPDEWDVEKEKWLGQHNFYALISKPTGVKKLLDELCASVMLNFWHDEVKNKIKLKAIAPPLANAPVSVLTEESNTLKKSFKVKELQDRRLSEVWVLYGRKDYTQDGDEENYIRGYVQADVVREGTELYGSAKIKKIISNWMGVQNDAQAVQMAGRLVARFADPPKECRFRLDMKDAVINVGDLVDIESQYLTDVYGAKERTRFEITERKETKQGEILEYTGLQSSYVGRYGFIGPNTLGDYSSESDDNKQQYAFICNNTGIFDDGTLAYKII